MKTIQTDQAPAAVGPYSQAVVHQGILYASGQIGLDPTTGLLVGDDVSSQTTRLMQNLSAVLQAADADKTSIIKVNIYLVNMGDFAQVNTLYATWLGDHRPARATVAVAALPLGAKVEMDVIAHV
ncbi:MAG: Rid family detoxifying hydrolase [Mariprofundaceae bacterium]|nr:Rid family detoxifying hydrolase [Mariprofundaceae bacterium]